MPELARKRIAIVIHSLGGGGAERCVSRLLQQWAAPSQELELHLILNKAEFAYELPPAVQVHVIGNERASTLGKLLDQPMRLGRLVELFNRLQPLAVLGLMPPSNLMALAARRLAHVHPRVVISERASFSSALQLGIRGRIVRLVWRSFYPYADALIAVSSDLAEEVQRTGRLPPGFATAIPNGVDADALMELARQEAAPHPWLRESRELPVVLSAGRLDVTDKAPDLLLDAWERVLARVPARLLILGDGPDREALTRRAARLPDGGASVQILPFQKNPFPFIYRADIFALASRREGFPNALLEAMSLARPCVAFDCPTGPRELLGANEHGFLVPELSVSAMADSLIQLLSDPGLRENLAAKAKARASAFSVEAMAERYKAVLLACAQENSVRA